MSIARLMQMARAGVPAGDVWTDPDLANASYDNVSFSVAGQETSPRGLFFKPDGLSVYIVGLINDEVHQYSLSSAWDVSSASFVRSFSVSSQEGQATGLSFKSDGTKMYIIGAIGDDINEYVLSTAWDISSASYSQNFSVSSKDTAPQDVTFSKDGLFFYITGGSDSIHSYSMSSAWDISTATFDSTHDVSTEDASPNGLFIAPDGLSIFIVGSATDAVYSYTLSSAFDLSTASYSGNSFSIASQEGSASALYFKSDGSKMYVLGTGNDTIYQYSTVTPAAPVWTDPDLANASYDSVSFSVAGEETSPRDLFFKPDGLKVYVSGGTGDDINEYDLSTAWDISTASYVQNFSVAAQEGSPNVTFKPDGTNMYVVGSSSDAVNQYSLSSAWDISTASYVQNFSVSTQEAAPTNVTFKPDGTKMYVLGAIGDDINEYDLSTAWDVSTASYLQNFSVATQETGPTGLFFNPNGTKMYVVGSGNDNVNEYDLSSAWDISSAFYVQNFNVATQETSPNGLFFKSDGSKMYIVGSGSDTIYQYSTD